MSRKASRDIRQAMESIDPWRDESASTGDIEAELARVKSLRGPRSQADGITERGVRTRPKVAIAATVSALGIAGALAITSGGDSAPGPTGQALATVAANAAEQGNEALPANAVAYLRTLSYNLDTAVSAGQTWETIEPVFTEKWVTQEGSERIRRTSGAREFASRRDRAAWRSAGSPSIGPIGGGIDVADRIVDSDQLTPSPPTELAPSDVPSDPQMLREVVESAASEMNGRAPPAAKALFVIADLLRDPRTRGEQRQAAYLAISEIDGVEHLGSRRDPIGRRGEAVGLASDFAGADVEYSLLYNPATGRPLASTEVGLHLPGLAGNEDRHLLSAEIYLESGSTESIRALPTGTKPLTRVRARTLFEKAAGESGP